MCGYEVVDANIHYIFEFEFEFIQNLLVSEDVICFLFQCRTDTLVNKVLDSD